MRCVSIAQSLSGSLSSEREQYPQTSLRTDIQIHSTILGLLDIGEMAFDLLDIEFAERNQDTRFLDIAEVRIESRVENLHRRREAHIGIDERRNRLVDFANLA